MATNHTEHYGLSLWEGGDKFYHEEFNENHRKIDDALASKADAAGNAAAHAAMQSVLNKTAQIVTGSYVGTGQYGSSHPNRLSFAGALDHPPKLVVIRPAAGQNAGLILVRGMGSSMYTFDANVNPNYVSSISWGSDSISWYCSSGDYAQLNTSGTTYYYVAIG